MHACELTLQTKERGEGDTVRKHDVIKRMDETREKEHTPISRVERVDHW
jgi:hypothetical protein